MEIFLHRGTKGYTAVCGATLLVVDTQVLIRRGLIWGPPRANLVLMTFRIHPLAVEVTLTDEMRQILTKPKLAFSVLTHSSFTKSWVCASTTLHKNQRNAEMLENFRGTATEVRASLLLANAHALPFRTAHATIRGSYVSALL